MIKKLQGVIPAFFVLLAGTVARADCGCEVTFVNGFDSTPVTITRIQTSDAGVAAVFFKEQWTGTLKIEAGKQHKFSLTVEGGCGNKHRFQFTKNDGKKCQSIPVDCGAKVVCSKEGGVDERPWL